jgi:hypothetical protein
MRRVAELTRPSAQAGARHDACHTAAVPTPLTVDEALTRFLDEQEERLAPRTFRTYEDVIDLLRHCVSGYGPVRYPFHARSTIWRRKAGP